MFAYLCDQYYKDKEKYLGTDTYVEYSFQACQYDAANPAFYLKDRGSYKAWGKNREKI